MGLTKGYASVLLGGGKEELRLDQTGATELANRVEELDDVQLNENETLIPDEMLNQLLESGQYEKISELENRASRIKDETHLSTAAVRSILATQSSETMGSDIAIYKDKTDLVDQMVKNDVLDMTVRELWDNGYLDTERIARDYMIENNVAEIDDKLVETPDPM